MNDTSKYEIIYYNYDGEPTHDKTSDSFVIFELKGNQARHYYESHKGAIIRYKDSKWFDDRKNMFEYPLTEEDMFLIIM